MGLWESFSTWSWWRRSELDVRASVSSSRCGVELQWVWAGTQASPPPPKHCCPPNPPLHKEHYETHQQSALIHTRPWVTSTKAWKRNSGAAIMSSGQYFTPWTKYFRLRLCSSKSTRVLWAHLEYSLVSLLFTWKLGGAKLTGDFM